MFVLRQIASAVAAGAKTALAAADQVVNQVVDVSSRMIMALLGPGKVSADFTQVAATVTFNIPLPQAYVTTNMLHVSLASDQTVEVSWTIGGVVQNAMIRAGLATDQNGVLVFCGPVTALSVKNPQAVAANVEWLLFELPAIGTVAGWRDGSLATGLTAP